ncbi:MAG: GspH/FimT family pseudopilin [Gammaproteobacteria bacterium]
MKTSETRIGMANSTSTTAGGFARASGFTMIEMVMTIAIATIVMTLAIPSFRYVTNSNRIAGEINGLLGDLQLARAEAIKEGRPVTVCTSTDGTTCAGSTAWQSGWIVFPDPANPGVHDNGEILLRVQKTFSGTDTFVSSGITAVTFNREGYASPIPNGTLITLHDSTNTSSWTRCLSITFIGQMTTEQIGGTANGTTCS